MNILQSQKNHLKYLEHTKIVKIDEKVAYTKDLESKEQFFAIPYANIAVLLLVRHKHYSISNASFGF